MRTLSRTAILAASLALVFALPTLVPTLGLGLGAGATTVFAAEDTASGGEWPAPDPDKKVGVAGVFTPATVAPGETTTLEVRISTSPRWHIYATTETEGLPTQVNVSIPEAWESEEFVEPTPHPFLMLGFTKPSMVHEGQIAFKKKITIPADFPEGTFEVAGSVAYQVCDDRTCLIPTDLTYMTSLTIKAKGAAGEGEGESKGDGGSAAPAKLDIQINPDHQWGVGADVDPAKAKPGGEARLRIHIHTAPRWHVYTLETDDPNVFVTRFSVDDLPEGFEMPEQKWDGPAPHPFPQPGMGPVMVHDGPVVFTRPIRIGADVEPGTYKITGKASAMACDDFTCMQPADNPFEATLVVDEAGSAAPDVAYKSENTESVAGGTGPTGSDKGNTGMLRLLVTAILGAMVSWIMPCVYPMIPITISFFGKLAEEKKTNKVAVAASYGLGIAGTFIVIGLVIGVLTMFVVDQSSRSGLASLGNVIATNPWVNLIIGVVFILFALSMFGMFTIQVPSWLISKTDSAGRASGSAHVGAILLGITFALASFTCTVPVVGLLLGLAASGTAAGFASSLLGMVVYGVVFAAPFVILSLSQTALANLPKAGGWMETVKIGFGFLELAVAIKFLWVPDLEWGLGLLSRPVVLGLFGIIGLATIAFFLGLFKVGHGMPVKPFRVSVGRYAAAVFTLLLMVPIGMSLAKPPAFQTGSIPGWVSVGLEVVLPPAPAGDELAKLEGWFVDEYDEAVAKAKAEGKALFIDFTGVYCGNCRAMENTVFPLEGIHDQLEQMVRTRLYVDRAEERHKRFARMQVERYGVASQPYYVILDPRDEATMAEDGGYISKGKFQSFLEGGLEKFAERQRDVARQ